METTRSYTTPATTSVYYEHKKNKEYIAEFKHKLMTISTAMVFSGILLQSSINFLLTDLTGPVESLVIVLYGLMVIIIAYVRRLALSKSPVLCKQVDFHKSPHRLSHGILYLNLALDLFTFFVLVTLITHLGNDTKMLIRLFTSIVAMAHAGVSYFIIRTYSIFIMEFQMYTVGSNRKTNRIL